MTVTVLNVAVCFIVIPHSIEAAHFWEHIASEMRDTERQPWCWSFTLFVQRSRFMYESHSFLSMSGLIQLVLFLDV
jgi:hypothetical protein